MASTAPSWLDEPPDGPEPKPPVETRGQSLPLGDLSWQNFERLILRLVRREPKVIECSVYGTPGQEQHGIDILATQTGKVAQRLCYQCKKVVRFSPRDVVAAVKKFLSGKWAQDTQEFVLCISISLEKIQVQNEIDRQRIKLSEKGIRFSVWHGATAGPICERLKVEPDLVDDFFGRSWVKSFNGQSSAEKLGERLNGYQLALLRARLCRLYSVLFLQHDPGLNPEGDRHFDYRDRYVTADVIERTQVDVVPADSPLTNQTFKGKDFSGDLHPPNSTASPSGKSATYETRRDVFDWLRYKRKCLIFGEPGYGKSAVLRYLALSILQPKRLDFDALNSSYFSCLPVWISFARFSAAVDGQQGISVDDFFRTWLQQHSFSDVFPLIQRAVRDGQVLLLLDGLDEAAAEHSGREALDRVVTFLQACDASIICTSRPGSYKSLRIPPSWTTATLAPLNDKKIEELSARWFNFLEPTPNEELEGSLPSHGRRRAQAFLRVARDSPRTLELARNPLLCQSLIQLFRFSHQLPEARVEAYKQIVELLLSKHPAARAQAGGSSSPLVSLDLRLADLSDILNRLAWKMQSQPGGSLTREQCEQVCAEFLVDDTFGLGEPLAKARRIAGEIVARLATRYGVLVERAPDEFNLIHLSIQEYLAAEFVARKSPEEQIEWVSTVWTSLKWRESLIAWFGILGARGEKKLSGEASQLLAVLGHSGEWVRIQSLELRTEIATADLGLPISEARRIIDEAIREVEQSPFEDLRIVLARRIGLGALGTPVRSECQAAIRRWLPGQSRFKRKRLLEAFQTWEASDALRATLLRAFQDEEITCRRAAVESFVFVFSEASETLSILENYATCHLQPEVRAVALRGLKTRPEWSAVAEKCAKANLGTANTELYLAVLSIRIQQRLQNNDDLNRLGMLWETGSIDYWIRDEPLELLCQGWPRNERLRNIFMEQIYRQSGPADIELPLFYLTRCYPGDVEVAEMVVSLIERFGSNISFSSRTKIWDELCSGFRGHAHISSALRTMMLKERLRYESIFWDPETVSMAKVLGDDAARDDLLTSYETANLRSRYWIANALLTGWGEDPRVWVKLKEFASQGIDMAAPLASWAEELIPSSKDRNCWLHEIARETIATREFGAIEALLRDVSDNEAKRLAEPLLEHPNIWYYNRILLQELYARAFPDEPKSIEILERSFSELEGPNPGELAEPYKYHPDFSSRFLAAAVPAPVDVRLAVATILRQRNVDYDRVFEMTPSPYAEENSSVRASYLMARACAARSNLRVTKELCASLISELTASGGYMNMRRRTALAALLELGCYEEIVSVFASDNSRWTYHLLEDWNGRDSVSIGAVTEHWGMLKPLLDQQNVNIPLPVSAMIRHGYGLLLEREPSLQQVLDSHLETQPQDFFSAANFDAFARRWPNSELLRSHLLNAIGSLGPGDESCVAARILAAHFRADKDIWPELASRLGTPQEAIDHIQDGVLGYLALGWPNGQVSAWVRALQPDQRAQLSARDRLLFAVLLKDETEAEAAAIDMLSEPMETRRRRMEDANALRFWAESIESKSALSRWIISENSSLSLTAVSLMAETRGDLEQHFDQLVERFNSQLAPPNGMPEDGLNGVTGRQVSWAESIYSTLSAWPRATF